MTLAPLPQTWPTDLPRHWRPSQRHRVHYDRPADCGQAPREARFQNEGRAKVSTISGFSNDFRSMDPAGRPHLCHWQDVLRPNPKRQVVWTVNSHYLAALDLNLGGVIVDLRAYGGRIDGDMGPDGAILENGNYPFLIASEHRGGFWNTGQAAMLEVNGQTVNLWDNNRVKARVERNGTGWIVEADPVVAEWDGGEARVVSRWQYDASGTIRLERTIASCTQSDAELAISEWFGGCFGTTEYPVDLRGIVLKATDPQGKELTNLPFTYTSGERSVDGAACVSADVPQAGVVVSLRAADPTPGLRDSVSDGTVFSPYYPLKLTQAAKLNEPVTTLLSLRGLR